MAMCFWRSALGVPLLPDLVPLASVEDRYLYDGEFDLEREPGRVLYRFDVVIANLGDGPFQVYEETDTEAQTQDIYQDVFDSEGGFDRQYRATFTDVAPSFGHLSFERLADYRLREITPGDGVGDVVAFDSKTSHAVVDSLAIDTGLPNAPAFHQYRSIHANPLGISVGYADLYGRNILEQRLDVTGVAAGSYWLEVEIDPLENVIETDRSNNTARIQVDLALDQPVTLAGDYNQDGVVNAIDYTVWRENLGSSMTLFNDTTFGVTASDRDAWAAAYGAVGGTAAATPEPTTFVMMAAAVVAIGARNFRRCRAN